MSQRQNSSSSVSAVSNVESLEKRQMFAASPVAYQGIKLALRPDGDNTALNSNRITMLFTDTVRIGDISKFRFFGYGVNLPGAGQKKVAINFTSVERDAADPRVLTFITDRLIRKGSRLFINQGALTDKNGNDVLYDGTTRPQLVLNKGQNKFRFSLANRAWAPTDLTFFNKETYTAAPNPTVANGSIATATVRASLATFLKSKRIAGVIQQGQVDASLAKFDNAVISARVPNPNLRAALLSLIGTAGAPAIASYLDGANVTGVPVTILDFSSEVSSGAVVAETTLTTGSRLRTLVKPEFSSEPFQSLSAILAHEAVHQDLSNTQEEEVITNTIESTVLTQQYAIDPSVASRGTQLVTRQNQRLLAMLNSGDLLYPYAGIKTAPKTGTTVFPGSNGMLIGGNPVVSYEDWIRREYISRGFQSGSTPGNVTLTSTITNILGTKPNVNFNNTTITNLDSGNLIVTDAVAIKMAQILKLSY